MSISTTRFTLLIQALGRILPMREPADMVLSQFFRSRPELGARDRAFVAESVYGILRRKRLLEHLAAPEVSPRRLVLVALTKLQGMSVRELEDVLHSGEAQWLQQAKAVEVDSLPLAVQCDLPDWLEQRLAAFLDEPALRELARGLQQPAPLDLRVNTFKASRDEVLKALADSGIEAAPTPLAPTGVRLKGKPALSRHPLFLEGKVEVQDEGSQLLALLVAPKRGDMVVDFCAGAGGKSLALGALMNSQGRIYAFDVAEKRLNNLKPRLKRSGLSNIHPQLINSENDTKVKRLAGKIDRVLVDAPCSGLGTLRRNPDLKWRQSPRSVEELQHKQRAILAAAARLVKPGGRLVYATCSLLPEENEAVVEAFLAADPGFRAVDCNEVLARLDVPLDTGRYLKLLPHVHGTDGFFAAVMERA